MPANRKIAQGQLACLVGWMQSNPLVARGAFLNTPQGKQRAGALWDELASRLNAMPEGCTKSAKEWRQMGDDVLLPSPPPPPSSTPPPPPPPQSRVIVLPLESGSPIVGSHSIPFESEIQMETEPELEPSPIPSARKRPKKRKHVFSDEDDGHAEPSRTQVPPPRWVLDLENRRGADDRERLELEKRRVALEERRLALEERRFEQNQKFEERRLALEERRFEDEQRWRHDILDTLKGIAELL
ncbi:uncharacterized protein [Epargyreus clarus]|uniref:uncharacterized protein n=1 Tax=Epargyreus clarus TaxID=520877 RepID=UPI003C2D6EAD